MNEDDNSIPFEWVPKYYDMDPKTEDMVLSTKDLKVGNVVVTAHLERRCELPDDITDLSENDRWILLERNRWSRVVEIFHNESNATYYAVLEFHDGVKRRMNMDPRFSWLVKKDSISPEEIELPEGVKRIEENHHDEVVDDEARTVFVGSMKQVVDFLNWAENWISEPDFYVRCCNRSCELITLRAYLDEAQGTEYGEEEIKHGIPKKD